MTRVFLDLPPVSTTALNPRVLQKLVTHFHTSDMLPLPKFWSLLSLIYIGTTVFLRWRRCDNGARFTQANDDANASG
ncbi:hypothetical protein Hanom_Chr09g00871421 [Helianthus anomalus]